MLKTRDRKWFSELRNSLNHSRARNRCRWKVNYWLLHRNMIHIYLQGCIQGRRSKENIKQTVTLSLFHMWYVDQALWKTCKVMQLTGCPAIVSLRRLLLPLVFPRSQHNSQFTSANNREMNKRPLTFERLSIGSLNSSDVVGFVDSQVTQAFWCISPVLNELQDHPATFLSLARNP